MKITNFIVCDDIRFETGGKHSLIGVYDNSIEFIIRPSDENRWPKALKIGIYSAINFTKQDKKRNFKSLKIKTDYNGSIKELVSGELPPEQETPTLKLHLAIVIDKMKFEGPGNIKFIFEFYGTKKLLETISPDYVLEISEKAVL